MKNPRLAVFLVIFFIGCGMLPLVPYALGSVRGRIEGIVTDSSGAPIDRVKVTIASLKVASQRYQVSTNKDGRFVQVGLWPGYYRVTFKKDGYMPVSKEVRVGIAAPAGLDVRLEKAEEYVAKNISKADKLFLKGNKLYEENRLEEAEQTYREAIAINASQWGYFFNLALTYKKMNRLEDALAAFREAVRLNPESYTSNKELGEILAKKGAYEEAKSHYKKAAEISPDDPDAFYNLGVCLINLGDSQQALASFLRTVELDEDYSDAYYQIGVIYVSQNQVEEAVKNLEKFLDLAPDHEKAPIARQMLEYLKK
ncbi:MAG: tetratricopeptide repeat protein [Candidatus Aminicenantales bacterium]